MKNKYKPFYYSMTWMPFVLVLVLVLFMSPKCFSSEILKVTSFWPQPNYPLCTDSDDIIQLTDGKIETYRMWTQKGAVGWKGGDVIQIEVDLSDHDNNYGKLLVHTGSDIRKGVEYPGSVDIYSISSSGSNTYLKGKIYKDTAASVNEDKWLSFQLENATKKILLVVQPVGSFVFIDEIKWSQNEIDREKQIRSNLRSPESNLYQKGESFGWVLKNPFLSLETVLPGGGLLTNERLSIKIIGDRFEEESNCIGVFNRSGSKQVISITSSNPEQFNGGINFFEVKPVVAANGQTIYDPLLPILENQKITIEPFQIAYFWVQVDLRKFLPGNYNDLIIITSADKSVHIEADLSIKNVDIRLNRRIPKTNNWGYSRDYPIWAYPNKGKAQADNIAHHINTFVVHPGMLPLPNAQGKWDSKKELALKNEIQFRGKGTFLFFLYLRPRIGTGFLHDLSDDNTQQKIVFKEWVDNFNRFMKKQGLTNLDWALYPVDEPNTEKEIDYLWLMAQWIKQVDSNIQIYANPTRRNILPALEKLEPYIDIWQPMYECAVSNLSFFENLEREWWVYDNPKSPAKAASPWLHYRLMSWKSWSIGASGVGFWSYSSTSKSSAWDDTDGPVADWAVVYESKGGPVSSRRWEAFREGVEDFQLLVHATEQKYFLNYPDSTSFRDYIKVLVNDQTFEIDKYYEIREKILERCTQ